MNRKNIAFALIAVAASLGSAAGHAAKGGDYPPDVAHGQSLTRAAVLKDLKRARAEGLVPHSDLHYPVVTTQAAQISRAEVRKELVRAHANGELRMIEKN